MSQKTLHRARPSKQQRPAIWPWVLMPLAALALFFALRTVRHSTGIVRSEPADVSGGISTP